METRIRATAQGRRGGEVKFGVSSWQARPAVPPAPVNGDFEKQGGTNVDSRFLTFTNGRMGFPSTETRSLWEKQTAVGSCAVWTQET